MEKEIKLEIQRKTAVEKDTGKTFEYDQVYLVYGDEKIAIKTSYKNDSKVLKLIARN